ncbi:MAG TPA: ribonuclease III [Rhodothermia bacterium]|nr:ribonuclease III [Rhodothermia bacterium]
MSLIARTLRTLGFQREDRGHASPEDRKERISQVTGLPVNRFELYELALRHSSLVRHKKNRHLKSNERLEFLGDAVLGLAAAEYVYERFPDKNEGFLTRLRAKLVNKRALADYADTILMQDLLEMSEDMDRAGGRLNPSMLANAFEALLGALYLDHGYIPARQFVLATIARTVNLNELAERRENYKSLLLEYAQARRWPQPTYQVLSEQGPGHQREFLVEVIIGSETYGTGQGRSKKTAEQRAAKSALKYMEKNEDVMAKTG